MNTKITGTQSEFDVILKVGMDGEVTGIFTLDGDVEWTDDWNDLCGSLRTVDILEDDLAPS